MCKSMSGILTRDGVLFDKNGDSHGEILRLHGIADVDRKPDFVKFEIVPPQNNYSRPLKEWEYNVDQDILPDWYVPMVDIPRARVALTKWAKHHIIRRGKGLCADGQTRIFLGKTTCTSVTGGECWAYDSAKVLEDKRK